MGEDTGGTENYREIIELPSSQHKAQDGFDRCWLSARINFSKSKTKTVAADSSLSLGPSIFFSSNLLTLVGQRDIT